MGDVMLNCLYDKSIDDQLTMNHCSPMSKLYAPEVAKMIGVSEGTLANMRSKGSGPKFSKTERKVTYDTADVMFWIHNKKFISSCQSIKNPSPYRPDSRFQKLIDALGPLMDKAGVYSQSERHDIVHMVLSLIA